MSSQDSISGDDKVKEEDIAVDRESEDETPTGLTPPAPEIDGGLRAWLQVLGSFVVFGNLWGFTFAFGSFQAYFESTLLPDQTASTISWIGTIQVFLLIFGGVLTGPLFDLGYYKTMLFTGAAVETLGVFLTSLCGEWYQFCMSILLGSRSFNSTDILCDPLQSSHKAS